MNLFEKYTISIIYIKQKKKQKIKCYLVDSEKKIIFIIARRYKFWAKRCNLYNTTQYSIMKRQLKIVEFYLRNCIRWFRKVAQGYTNKGKPLASWCTIIKVSTNQRLNTLPGIYVTQQPDWPLSRLYHTFGRI